MLNKIKRYLKDPYFALGYDMIKKVPRLMSDKYYLSVLWRMKMGYKLDWNHPKTFNEKLQWLKLYDRNPLYTMMVDKYRVKQWVAEKIGEQHVVPTIAVYKSVDEISLDLLPDQFVLKCNHDSGSVVICRDKSRFDLEAAKQKLSACLRHEYFWSSREWAYKHVKPVVFAEKYMLDSTSAYGGIDNSEWRHEAMDAYSSYERDGGDAMVGASCGGTAGDSNLLVMNSLCHNNKKEDLLTYKFMCFDGKPYIMYVTVKGDEIWENYYDLDFNLLDIKRDWDRSDAPLRKPKTFEKMKDLAVDLSEGIPHVRIDLYEVGNEVFFQNILFMIGKA